MTALRACALVALLLPSLPLYASGGSAPATVTTKAECVAEVELVRVTARGQSVDYAVSIRHDAPTGVASVNWTFAIDYVGEDGAAHTISGKAGLGDARSGQTLRSRPRDAPPVPIRSVTGQKVTDTTCSYRRVVGKGDEDK